MQLSFLLACLQMGPGCSLWILKGADARPGTEGAECASA